MALILIFIKLTVSQASDFLFMLGTVITVEHLEQIKRVCHFPSKKKKKTLMKKKYHTFGMDLQILMFCQWIMLMIGAFLKPTCLVSERSSTS